jgi:hypothetical protein
MAKISEMSSFSNKLYFVILGGLQRKRAAGQHLSHGKTKGTASTRFEKQ